MRIKTFLLFSTSVFATSIFLIVFHSQQPQSIQSIFTQTHQHIKDFQTSGSTQENLRNVEEAQLVQEEKYFHLVGLDGSVEPWHNTTLPVFVTYASGDGHALAVSFLRAHAKLPYTVLLYNLGLSQHSLAVVSNYCNSSKCVILDFDFEELPSHVSDLSIHAFRPLIIQHALARVGGVIFSDTSWQWTGGAAPLAAAWERAASGAGVLAWPRRRAVTSLTHRRMFHYLHADLEDYLFVQMVDVSRLLVVRRHDVELIMKEWIQCALTLDCIMPIGAQSGGCRFDKKPQYRYSGCHGQDGSALSILLGRRFQFEEARYTWRAEDGGGAGGWRGRAAADAAAELAALRANATDDARTDTSDPLPYRTTT